MLDHPRPPVCMYCGEPVEKRGLWWFRLHIDAGAVLICGQRDSDRSFHEVDPRSLRSLVRPR